MEPCHVDQGDMQEVGINKTQRECPEQTPKGNMPPSPPIMSAPFTTVQAPSFQHVFGHFMEVFRGLRRLNANRPLSQSFLFLRFISAFRDPVRRLLSTLYPSYSLLGQADEGAAHEEEISAVEPIAPNGGLDDHTKTIRPQMELVGTGDRIDEDVREGNTVLEGFVGRESAIISEASPLLSENTEEVHSMREVQVETKVRKKALLIGVRNNRLRSDMPANSPTVDTHEPSREHRDAKDMRSLLEDVYNYDPKDITFLIDDNEPDHVQPTRDNIFLHIKKLIEGATQNDHFFFQFVGHSLQEDTDDREEEDGKNEFILTSDGEQIMDDELRECLVDPLPPTCSLTAIFDSCHSCSLLDLPHFRCNRVYVPWLNRGKRRTDTILAKNQRKLDIDHYFEHLDLDANLPSNLLLKSALASPSTRRATEFPPVDQAAASPGRPKPLRRPRILTETISEPTNVPGVSPHSARAIASPISLYCHGNCRKDPIFMRRNIPKTDVICLSSSKDSQPTWVRDGSTMTQYLIKLLREQPKRKLKDVLSIVSHDIHRSYIEMHDESRDYKRQVRQHNHKVATCPTKKKKKIIQPPPLELHNFQDPQISSLRPLDMDRYFEP